MIASFLRQASFIGKMRYYFMDRYYSLTIRVLAVGVCIAMTLVSTLLLRNASGAKVIAGFLPALLLSGIAGFILLYFNLDRLPVVILLMTLFLSDGISTGTGTKLTFTFLMLNVWAVLWMFKMFVVDRKVEVRYSPSNLLALLFMAAVVISYFWSYAYVEKNVKFVFDDKFLARTMTAVVLIISPGAYFLYANHLRSMKAIRTFVWVFIAAGVVMLILHFAGLGARPLLNAKAQFPAWVGGLALGQVLFNKHLHYYLRLILIAMIGGWFFIQLGEGISWLSGWLPLSIACGIIVFFYSRRLFLVLVIAAGVFYFAQKVFVQDTIAEENQVSGETRVEAWQQVLTLTGKHYLFGTGPAGYQFYFSTYQGYMYQLSHNNYIDIVAQTGVVGFGLFVGFWISTSYMTLKMFWSMPKSWDFRHGLALSLLGFNVAIYVIMMLGDWITPFTYTQGLAGIDYDIWPWMMTGLTVALYYENQKLKAQSSVQTAPIAQSDDPALVPQIAPQH